MDETTLNQKQSDDCEIYVDQTKKTFVIVAAQHIDPSKNFLNKVPCKKGVPMAGHVFDSKYDSYFLPCVDFILLGTVDAAAYMRSKSNHWEIRIPLSVSVLSHFIEPNQTIDLKNFLESYTPEEHVFHYLQMIDPHESFPPIK